MLAKYYPFRRASAGGYQRRLATGEQEEEGDEYENLWRYGSDLLESNHSLCVERHRRDS